jgi:amino acid adenylation domain-containing protein
MTQTHPAAPAAKSPATLERVPVTPMQRRLLVQHLMLPEDGAFNLAYAFRLVGPVNVARLTACVDRVLDACVALNTTFEQDADGLHAVLRDHGGRLVVVDLPGPGDGSDRAGDTDEGAGAEEERAVARWLAERADTPMPPDRWPLYDMRLHRGRTASYLTVLSSHLISDAYTWYNLIDRVAQLYRDPAAWPKLAADFALHPASVSVERATPDAAAVAALHGLLADVPALTHEALAVNRSAHPALTGISRRIPVPRHVSERLRDSGLLHRNGPFATFLAVYAVVLGRLTGRSQVVVGVPLGNRRGPLARRAFGYFVNTLPLPVDLTAHDTFDQLSAHLAAQVFTLLRHQDFDLSAHAAAVLGRANGGVVATDNAFTYYKQPLKPDFDGCTAEPVPLSRRLIKYPFGMNVENQGEDYLLNLEYLTCLADADPASGVLHVLATVAERPGARLSELGLLDPARSAAVAGLAGPVRQYRTPLALDDWFRSVVREHADRPAVSDPNGTISYAQLDAQVDRVADAVDRLATGDVVAIAMHRDRRLIPVILGVLRSGRSYLPIDPSAPPERVSHIVAQFTDVLLVADPDALPAVDVPRRVSVDQVLADRTAGGHRTREPVDRRDDIAYTIFTSGSTGVPKGVQVTHRNVMRLFRSAQDHFDFGATDTWCLFHSYAFDFSVWEIFGALLYGGRLVIVPDQTARNPVEFLDLLVRERVTVLNQTPSAFRRLTGVLGHGPELAVRWVVFGGEALHFDVLRPWLDSTRTSARLVNMYGITETTVHVTFFEVDPDTVGVERTSVIGRPLGDLQVSVVDRDLNRCPVGVPGELLVGGAGLALGYRNRPDLTEQRFLRGSGFGDVVYRTGDQGYLRPDGSLVYLGRIDKQVQLRGYRIELGEIEAALLAAPGVQGCAVLLDQPTGGEPRLVAYLTGDPGPDAPLRQQLGRRLPAYMVPAVFVRMPAIPLTVNGKVAEHLLPRPEPAGSPVTGATEGAGTADELAVAVARIWAETVQVGAVGLDDNFFDIGGTSMHVAQVHGRLTTELRARGLSMVELFEFPTPRALADRVRSHTTAASARTEHHENRPDQPTGHRPAPRRTAGRSLPARRVAARPTTRKDDTK